MKITLKIMVILLGGLFIVPAHSYASDISIGASAWYATWDIEFIDSSTTADFGSGLLYGPVLSIKFSQNWSISSMFLYGKFPDATSPGDQNDGSSFDLSRMDSDTLLNYSLNKYLKIFVGFKYMKWEFTGGSHVSPGGGGGIGFILPVINNVYFLGNVAGLYIDGYHKNSNSENGTDKDTFIEKGYNGSVSLAYYIQSASTTISLGYRFQFIKTVNDEKKSDDSSDEYTSKFYGVTLALVYSFEI